MSLRRKLMAAAIAAGALVGSAGAALAQDPNQAPAQPAPAPSSPSTPASPPSAGTVEPNAPTPGPAVNPSQAAPSNQPGAAVEAPQPPVPEEVVAAPAPGKRGGKQFGEEIVVTGSRIRRKDLTTPAPVAVLSKEQIQASGKVSLGEFLQSLPEQGNALNTQVNNGGSGATRIDLRGLGNTRTLVLLNGRRMVASGTGADTGNGVDINTIPIAAVERIEVLKDGASSVYGSDAISGVVNIITRRSFNGMEFNAYEGISSRGDGNTIDLNVTAGTSSENGSFMFSGGFYDAQQVMSPDRPWSASQLDYDWNGNVTTLGSSRVPNGRILSPNLPGTTGNPSSSYTYDPAIPGCAVSNDPTVKPQAKCFRPFTNADLYNFQRTNYDVTPNRRINLFSAGELKLSDTVPVKAFFEGSYTNRSSAYQLAEEPLIVGAGGLPVTVSKDNYYNPFGQDFTQVTRRLTEFGPRRQSEQVDTFRIVGGLNGQIPVIAWSWDAALIYGRTDWSNINTGNIWSSRLQNAVGPTTQTIDPKTGKVTAVTCGTAANPIGGGCVPLNLFGGSGSMTPAMAKYLSFSGVGAIENELTSVQLNTAGELPVTLFADRPLALAVGYEYRFEQGSDTPDPLTASGESSGNNRSATSGHFFTNEVYAELSIPIMNHVPGVENLEATASARIFDYSTFGTDWTYKLGARYSPVSDVTFRGTYSTAYRAPTIAELFAGAYDNFPTISDPCSGVNKPAPPSCPTGVANNGSTDTQLRSQNGGNPHLKPETAKTYTFGAVIEPSMVKNLSFTVDYYHIDITNAISAQGAGFILSQCYPSAGNPNPAACALVTRDASGFVDRISDLNVNVGGTRTAGVDVAARYSIPTEEFGRFGLGVDGNFLQFYDVIQPDGTVIHGRGNYDIGQINNGLQGVYPTFKGIASVVWGLGGFGAGGTLHYIGNIKQCAASDGTSTGGVCYDNPLHMERDVGAYATVDAFLSYGFKSTAGTTSLAVGVNNLFDAAPRTIYGALTPNSDPTAYDYMGRFFYVRLGQRL